MHGPERAEPLRPVSHRVQLEDTTYYGVIFGRPGDALIGLGRARRILGPKFGVIYVGTEPAMQDFFRRQHGVTDCLFVHARAREYDAMNQSLCCQQFSHEKRPVGNVPARAGIDPSLCVNCCIDWAVINKEPLPLWHGARLSREALAWAHRNAPRQPYWFVCPISTGTKAAPPSSAPETHWPHWDAAVRLLVETGHPLVVTGWPERIRARNVCNMTGRTTLEQAWALQQLATGSITTSNNFAHMAAINSLPAIVMNNHSIGNSVFDRFNEAGAHVEVVKHGDGLYRFEFAILGWL